MRVPSGDQTGLTSAASRQVSEKGGYILAYPFALASGEIRDVLKSSEIDAIFARTQESSVVHETAHCMVPTAEKLGYNPIKVWAQ